jgi:hypothetical protein
MSNLLPINGQAAGEVANQYNPLLHPADFTSSIWIAIFALLVSFMIFLFRGIKDQRGFSALIISGIGFTFMIACLANAGWVLAWHYQQLTTTVILSIILLLSLIDINRRIRKIEIDFDQVPKSFRWLVKVPFGLYLGWASIILIANISLYLIANGWDHTFFSPEVSAITLIIFAGIIGLYLMDLLRTYAPAIAIAWGLFGILISFWQNNTNVYIQNSAIIMIALIAIGSARLYRKVNSIQYK